ncbi:hypothetical protein KM043_012743 [Ampulex compressa]|nr:hypothetical protein KM043_012743 [Ampulex compressa]
MDQSGPALCWAGLSKSFINRNSRRFAESKAAGIDEGEIEFIQELLEGSECRRSFPRLYQKSKVDCASCKLSGAHRSVIDGDRPEAKRRGCNLDECEIYRRPRNPYTAGSSKSDEIDSSSEESSIGKER